MTIGASTESDARAALTKLVLSLAAGDLRAMPTVYERTSAKLYGIILRVLPSPLETEEVLQDVYLTLWKKASTFDPTRSSPITWLATIARNKAIDRLRSLHVRAEELSPRLVDTIADTARNPLQQVEWSQELRLMFTCLDGLDIRLKRALTETVLDGDTQVNVAQRLGIPLGTLKTRVRRGLQQMRDEIATLSSL